MVFVRGALRCPGTLRFVVLYDHGSPLSPPDTPPSSSLFRYSIAIRVGLLPRRLWANLDGEARVRLFPPTTAPLGPLTRRPSPVWYA